MTAPGLINNGIPPPLEGVFAGETVDMDLVELGQMLRAERERQGISRDDVIERLKVSRSVLAAIEEGRLDGMPHPVYAKGFIKNLAAMLNLDVAEISDAFERCVPVDETQYREPKHIETRHIAARIRDEDDEGRDFPVGLVLVVVAVLALGAAAYFYGGPLYEKAKLMSGSMFGKQASEATKAPDAPAPAPVQAPAAKPAETPKADAKPAAEAPKAPAPAVVPAPAPAQTPEPAKPAEAPKAVEAATAPSSGTGSPFDGVSPADEKTLAGNGAARVVEILAQKPTWLEASVDGGAMKEFYLHKGQRLTSRFADKMNVKIGNIQGVLIRVDGKDMPTGTYKGSVKTLSFP